MIMGGWASNSKYPFLGSLRSAAQMISYEVSIGLIIIVGDHPVYRVAQLRRYRGRAGWPATGFFSLVLAAASADGVPVLHISALAETNRPPFDLPEAESELVAGYQVEYSSTPFLLFMAG